MKFSIIIPAYNAEKFIQRSVNSVLKQTCEDFEILVINDGSSDRTLQVASSIADERIKVINQNNQGVSVARNTGIENALGEYICFLDADDEYLDDHLETLLKMIIMYPSVGFYVTRYQIMLLDGKVVKKGSDKNITYISNMVREMMDNHDLVWAGCVCANKELFSKYGMFAVGVKIGEDVDMWRRIYVHTGAVISNETTVLYNRDGSEATKSYIRSFEADPLNRMKCFIEDESIAADVKESLVTEHEWTKLEVVRSNLLIGNKKLAYSQMKKIDKSKVPFKRRLITNICFAVPSKILRMSINLKNKGMYK